MTETHQWPHSHGRMMVEWLWSVTRQVHHCKNSSTEKYCFLSWVCWFYAEIPVVTLRLDSFHEYFHHKISLNSVAKIYFPQCNTFAVGIPFQCPQDWESGTLLIFSLHPGPRILEIKYEISLLILQHISSYSNVPGPL